MCPGPVRIKYNFGENGDNRTKYDALHAMTEENVFRASKHRGATRERHIAYDADSLALDGGGAELGVSETSPIHAVPLSSFSNRRLGDRCA
jgi:hypothetical protein